MLRIATCGLSLCVLAGLTACGLNNDPPVPAGRECPPPGTVEPRCPGVIYDPPVVETYPTEWSVHCTEELRVGLAGLYDNYGCCPASDEDPVTTFEHVAFYEFPDGEPFDPPAPIREDLDLPARGIHPTDLQSLGNRLILTPEMLQQPPFNDPANLPIRLFVRHFFESRSDAWGQFQRSSGVAGVVTITNGPCP